MLMCIWKIIKLAYSLNYKQLQLSTSVGPHRENSGDSQILSYTQTTPGAHLKEGITVFISSYWDPVHC